MDADSLPDATGIPEDYGEAPVERIEHLGDALKRLCQGAGKEDYDTLVIQEGRGLSSDGLVVTEIKYAFGFEARLSASLVKSCLNHVTQPELKVTKKNVILKEAGRRFQLSKLVRNCFIPEHSKPETTVRIMGEWLNRMLPILPGRTGHEMFAGVYACEEGYVGGDGGIVCWFEAPGVAEGAIIPKQLIGRIPSGEVDFHVDMEKGMVWVIETDTIWTAPLVYGTYPPWQKAFFTVDREALVDRRDLIAALRAILSVEPYTHFVVEREKERMVCLSVRMADARSSGNIGSRAQASVALKGVEGDDFTVTLDARRLMGILEKMKGDRLSIGSDARQDRVWIKPLDMKPQLHVMQGGVGGFGAAPSEIE